MIDNTTHVLTKDVFISTLNEIIKSHIDLYMMTESQHYLEVVKQLHGRMDKLLEPEFAYYS